MGFDAKTDTPAAATAVAAADKFVFGDVSADGWDTILSENVLDALIRLSAGAYYAYASSQHTIKDGAGGLAELITDKLIARKDGGVAGTDEVQVYHTGSHGYINVADGYLQVYTQSGVHLRSASGAWLSFQEGQDSVVICEGKYLAWSTSGDAWHDTKIIRDAEGQLRLTKQTTTNIGAWLCGVVVEANTAGSGSPNILTQSEARKVLTNEGTAAENYHTLPTAAAGLDFEFICQDGDGIRVVANTGDTIRDVGTVSASAGYIRSSTIGSVIRLKAINAVEWIVVSKQGTWTIDS